MHITASVFVNDDEHGLHADLKNGWKGWLQKNLTDSTSTTGPAKTTQTPI